MSIYVIFAIERNIFAIMKEYKYNSSSNETMFTISFTPERGPLCKTTHQPHSVSVMCVCVYVWGDGKSRGWWTERPRAATRPTIIFLLIQLKKIHFKIHFKHELQH